MTYDAQDQVLSDTDDDMYPESIKSRMKSIVKYVYSLNGEDRNLKKTSVEKPMKKLCERLENLHIDTEVLTEKKNEQYICKVCGHKFERLRTLNMHSKVCKQHNK